MTTHRGAIFMMAAAALLTAGCGSEDSGPETVAVSGTVLVDGKPIEGAEVNFYSAETKFLASGMTDAEGKFTLYQGAVVGENKVWISKDTSKSDTDPEGMDPAENPEADSAQMAEAAGDMGELEAKGEILPPKFSNSEQSVLKFNVPEGGTEAADFKITSE